MAGTRPVALLSGASGGIASATTLALVEAGFQVVGVSRKASSLPAVAGVTFLDMDITSDESVAAVVKEVLARFGRLDVLVNNAGVGIAGAAEEVSAAQAQKVFDVNFFGMMRTANAVLPHMRAQGRGRIVNVSSVLGFVANPYMAVYCASKYAVEGYTESLDHEVREFGVRAVLVQPGPVNTHFEGNMWQADTPLPVYAERRAAANKVQSELLKAGDDPATIAKTIVKAATDAKPSLRYTAGSAAGRLSIIRRLLPAQMFDKEVRKANQMP